MNNKLLLGLLYEFLWFAFAAIASYLLALPVINETSTQFFNYLLWSLFLVFTYFRFIAFMMRSVILESIFVKISLLVINVPLFFFVMNQYYTYGRVYDEYNFTLASNVFQHIKAGTDLDDLMYIKQLVTFAGIASMTVITLLEIRLVYAVFKLRQLDKYLHKDQKSV